MAMACSPISSVWRGYCRKKTPGFEEYSTSVLDTNPFLAVRIPFLFTQMDPLSNEYTLIPPDPVPGGPSGRSRLKTLERDRILSFHCARKKYSQARQRHQSRDVSFTLGTHSRLEHYPASGSSWDCAWYKYTSQGRPRWPSTRVLSSSLKIVNFASRFPPQNKKSKKKELYPALHPYYKKWHPTTPSNTWRRPPSQGQEPPEVTPAHPS